MATRRARGVRDQSRVRPPEPRGGGDQPDAGGGAGDGPVPPEPVRPLARAAAPAGGAGGARLRRRRGEPARRQRGDRRRGDARAGRRVHAEAMARVDDEAERLRDGGAAAVLCDAAARPPGRRASGRACRGSCWPTSPGPTSTPRTPGGSAARPWRSWPRSAAPTARPSPLFRAEPALRMADFDRDKVIEVGMVVTPGRDRRDELRRLLGLDPGEARLLLRRPLRPGGPRLGAGRGAGTEGGPLRRLPPGAGRARAEPPRRPARRLDRGRPRGLGRRDRGQGRLRHGLRGDGRGHADDLPAPDRVRRAPRARPRPPLLGRRPAGDRPATSPSCGSSRCSTAPSPSSPARPRSPPTAPRGSPRRLTQTCLSAPGAGQDGPTRDRRQAGAIPATMNSMKFIIHPAVEPERLGALKAGGAGGRVGQRGRPRRRRSRRPPGPTPSSARSRRRSSRRPTGSGGSRRSRPAWSTTCSPSWSPTRAR